MIKKPWEDFRKELLLLPKSNQPITVDREGVIIDEELFVKSHIAVIDQFPKKENLSNREKDARLFIAKPHYDRLTAYYILKTQL